MKILVYSTHWRGLYMYVTDIIIVGGIFTLQKAAAENGGRG